MDKFVYTYDHSKLNQKGINQLNRSITQNECEAGIKSLPQRKVQDLKDSLLNSPIPLKKN
jgi:NADH/NAD ratio-sensing transcriptional regulator Rex